MNEIKIIEEKTIELLKIRDSNTLIENKELRGYICDTIGHFYLLESCILSSGVLNSYSSKFFTSDVAILRHYRDWNLDNVADIYQEVRFIALKYLSNL